MKKHLLFVLLVTVSFASSARDEADVIACYITEAGSMHGMLVYDVVDVEPVFPEGILAMNTYIFGCLNDLPDQPVCSKVYVSFIINPMGEVCFVEIAKGCSQEFDALLLKCISEMPNWSPALVDEKPVACRFTLPINICYH
jgi:protein TonB